MWNPIIRSFDQDLMDSWTTRMDRFKIRYSMEEFKKLGLLKCLCAFLKKQAEIVRHVRQWVWTEEDG